MSIHTILSQEIEKFNKQFPSVVVNDPDKMTVAKQKDWHKFMRSFATRIVEEVGKELIEISCANCQQYKMVSQDDVMREALKFWREHKTRIGNSYCKIDHIDIKLRTKLQKMKEI